MTSKKLPHYVFDWRGVLAILFGMLIPLIIVGFFSLVYTYLTGVDLMKSDLYMMILNALIFLGAIAAFDFFVCRPTTGKKLNFNFSPTNFKTYLLVFPMMLGMMLIAEFFTNLIPVTGPFFGPLYEWYSNIMNQLSKDTSVMFIMAVIMAPIFEEIIFRGIIQKGLINGGVAPKYAIVLSALIFGLFHGNPWQFVAATLLGLVLGLVYFKTKSLLIPMLLHAFNNLVSTLLVEYHHTESFEDAFHVNSWVILMVGVVLFSVFYYLFMYKNNTVYKN